MHKNVGQPSKNTSKTENQKIDIILLTWIASHQQANRPTHNCLSLTEQSIESVLEELFRFDKRSIRKHVRGFVRRQVLKPQMDSGTLRTMALMERIEEEGDRSFLLFLLNELLNRSLTLEGECYLAVLHKMNSS